MHIIIQLKHTAYHPTHKHTQPGQYPIRPVLHPNRVSTLSAPNRDPNGLRFPFLSQVDTIDKCMGYIIAMDIRLEKLEKESEQRTIQFREQKARRHDTKIENYYQTMLEEFQKSLKERDSESYTNPQSTLFKTFQTESPAIIDSTNYVDTIKNHMKKWMTAKNSKKIYDIIFKKRNLNSDFKYTFEVVFRRHHLELYMLMC